MVAATSRKSVSSERTRRDIDTNGVQWDKKMSNNCAFSLLVYTLLQIFVVMGAIETKGMSIAPYFGLLILVAFIIPFCRKYEQKWQNTDFSGFSEQSIAAKFRKDQVVLWAMAIGLPFLFVAVFKGVASLF